MKDRCATCAWWRRYPPVRVADIDPVLFQQRGLFDGEFGPDRKKLIKNEVERHLGVCELFEYRDSEQVHQSCGLYVTRTGTGEATIVTRSDFGCIKHKPLKKEPNE